MQVLGAIYGWKQGWMDKEDEMTEISIFGRAPCKQGRIARAIYERTGKSLITDDDISGKAAGQSGIHVTKTERVFSAEAPIFNRFTHERRQSIAHLKLAVARILSIDEPIFCDFSSQLIPKRISPVTHWFSG